MATKIECPYCGSKLGSELDKCPQCGANIDCIGPNQQGEPQELKQTTLNRVLLWMSWIEFVLFWIGFFVSDMLIGLMFILLIISSIAYNITKKRPKLVLQEGEVVKEKFKISVWGGTTYVVRITNARLILSEVKEISDFLYLGPIDWLWRACMSSNCITFAWNIDEIQKIEKRKFGFLSKVMKINTVNGEVKMDFVPSRKLLNWFERTSGTRA